MAAAEAKRIAAEKVAREAASKTRPASDAAAASREALTAAEQRFKAAEERLAALEKERVATPPPGDATRQRVDEEQARLAALAAVIIPRATTEKPGRNEVRLYSYMHFRVDTPDKSCVIGPLPAVEAVKQASYGSLVFRDVEEPARTAGMKGYEQCNGLKGMTRVVYYVVDDKRRGRARTDAVATRVRYLPTPTRVDEFDVNLEQRTATRTQSTVVQPVSTAALAPGNPDDGLAKRTALAAAADNKVQSDAAARGERRLWHYANVSPQCTLGAPAVVEVVKAPSHGTLLNRDEASLVFTPTGGGLEKCIGTSVPGTGVYYSFAKDGARAGTDAFSIRVHYPASITRIDHFEVDLATRISRRVRVESVK